MESDISVSQRPHTSAPTAAASGWPQTVHEAFKAPAWKAGLSVETVQPGRFTGQVIRDGERIVYASLPTTKKWLAENKWQTARPFAI